MKNKILKKARAKRAQLKIQQMAFMLIALTIFFVLVGLVFLSVKTADINKEYARISKENAMKLASKLANAPEFSCGKSFGETRINCIDADKAMIMKEKSQSTYKGFWDVAEIQIRKIYPETQGDKECSFSTYPNCNIIKVYSKYFKNAGNFESNYISLCRKESFEGESYDKCELGLIRIRFEKKEIGA